MPFLTLDNNWSNLAQYYNNATNDGVFSGTPNNPNVTYTKKPEIPKLLFNRFDDGLIRGGLLNVGLAVARDNERIIDFYKSSRGLLFLAKQVGLQLSNPELERSRSYVFFSNSNTRLYNLGINTLAQVSTNAFGGHITRHGLLPIPIDFGKLQGNSTKNVKGYNYEEVVKELNIESKSILAPPTSNPPIIKIKKRTSTNIPTKPVDLSKSFVINNNNPINPGTPPPSYIFSFDKAPNRLLRYLKTINTDASTKKTSNVITRPITLDSYLGGPDSLYGIIGFTTIKTSADQRTNASSQEDDPKLELLNNFIPLPYSKIDEVSNQINGNTLPRSMYASPNNAYAYKFGVNRQLNNVETIIGTSIKKSDKATMLDSINMIDITDSGKFYTGINDLKKSNEILTNIKDKDYGGYYGKDIIKFRIEFLNNNSIGLVTDVLAFRAYIDEFSDAMQSKWNPYRYMGRGEEFFIYDGFTRDIQVSFTIFAHTKEEMGPIYRKLNYLLSTFAPDYNPGNKMRGNIAYLTVGDYLARQPGVFTDIRITNMLDHHWETNTDWADDKVVGDNDSNISRNEIPKYMKVSLSFKPIHSTLPRKVTRNNPFLSNFVLHPPSPSTKNITDNSTTIQDKQNSSDNISNTISGTPPPVVDTGLDKTGELSGKKSKKRTPTPADPPPGRYQ